jgi:predicted permease
MDLADPNFKDFREQNQTLSALAEYSYSPISVVGGNEPARTIGATVSQEFFKVLGVQPFLGRLFSHEELQLHGTRAAIVSYGYWQRFLGGSEDLSKFHLTINGNLHMVVGVMPREFDFPHSTAVWIARETEPEIPSRTAHSYECIGRLRDGVTVPQASADLDSIAKRINLEFGKKVDLMGATVIPLADAITGNLRVPLLTLFGAVILLFFVSSANVTGLLLARTWARRKELAVRIALGAGHVQILQHVIAESLILSIAGAVLGILFAAGILNVIPKIMPGGLPNQQGIAINAPVVLFTLLMSLFAASILGLITAWRAGRGNLVSELNASSRTYSATSQRLHRALVIGEFSATLVLLVIAGLLGRSFLKLISVNPGFSGQDLMILKFSPPQSSSLTLSALTQPEIERQTNFLDDVLTRLRAIPGVQSAGLTGGLPVTDASGFPGGTFLILDGLPAPTNFEQFGRIAQNPKNTGRALYCVAGDSFFQTLGVPLISGRIFEAQDGPEAPHVAVISETLARLQWPGENPVGQVIDFGNMDGNLKPLTIVGVVGDIRALGLDQPPSPIIYVNSRQRGLSANTSPAIVLRTSLPSSSVFPSAHKVFQSLDPTIPVQFSTFAKDLGERLAQRRFLLLLACFFAGAALTLAAVGTYGLVVLSVMRRTHEIAIRLALGAKHSNVLLLIVGEGARLGIVGVLIGFAGSVAGTRLIRSLLFELTPGDPLTFAIVAALLSVVAIVASYLPARRATRLDPNTLLRYE